MENLKNEIIGKAGFLLYVDYWEKYFCKMTGEQLKEVMKIIFYFNETYEVLETTDLAVDMVVATIVDNLKRDASKRIKKSQASRENGGKGGRPLKLKTNPVKPDQTQLAIQQEFEKIYRLYNSDKEIRVVPFDKLKNQFKAALSKVSLVELEENVLAYLAYLKTALWRKKKDFAAWINSSEFYANDWLAEIKRENNQIAVQAKPISAADEWKKVKEQMDQQNIKQITGE